MTNNGQILYFDCAASTRVDESVLTAMLPYFTISYANPSSSHHFGEHVRQAVESSRRAVAKKLSCQADEIFFTSGGTEANNLALFGLAEADPHKKHIITTTIEHPSVLHACRELERRGYSITYLPVNKEGLVLSTALENAIFRDTLLVSIIHANNEIGTIQPLADLSYIAKRRGVFFHTDAVQSFCKVPIPLDGIDLCSLSAHKIYGPKGVGAIFVRKGTPLNPLFFGGGQEKKYRPGTENVPGIVGFGCAVTLPYDLYHMANLQNQLIEGLLKIPGTKLNGHRQQRLPNNVSISFSQIEAETLLQHLDAAGIMASIGSACHAHILEPSHVLLAIGLPMDLALGTLRLTFGQETTEQDVQAIVKKIKTIVSSLRSLSS